MISKRVPVVPDLGLHISYTLHISSHTNLILFCVSQLRKEQVESVNVGGTNNVINVCVEKGITRLVYTSTINVTFAGKPIEEGDEDSLPCVPLDMHIDHYSRTKSISDQMVLTANGRSLKGKRP
ncbi:unnamed protein product [Oncorhynchus mykiss]|uniref:3-beta hydroxysteroid dehydrogenase/isomerase domain-containing protein n=1 Tax=Oncorhynchus mykiss TaxID=8022 RepID=A0A060Z2V8_ONCMY|nr:unnamed protein product [Oncorhynchus mykiss]